MEVKDIIENKDTEQNNTLSYMPSSSEKKRAVMMYLFFGIMVYLSKKDVTVFEYYHLKQASWRWILFLLVLVLDIVLLFIPVLKILWLLPLIALVAIWAIAVKQARDWKYSDWTKTSFMDFFAWIWNRFIELFELNVHEVNPMDTDSVAPKSEIESDIEKDMQQNNTSTDLPQQDK